MNTQKAADGHWLVHDVFEFRRDDYSLTEEQDALRTSCMALFGRSGSVSAESIAAEKSLDEGLWQDVLRTGLVQMSVPERHGGDGAGLIELVIAADVLGYHRSAIPLLESIVAARVLAQVAEMTGEGHDLLSATLSGAQTLCCVPVDTQSGPLVVPWGPFASAVLWWRSGHLLCSRLSSLTPPVSKLSGLPVLYDLRPAEQDTIVLARGATADEAWLLARRDMKLLLAAAIVGAASRALDLAIEFAAVRRTRGVTIGSLQGVAHPIVEAEVALTGARNLCRKAAWYLDNEPASRPDIVTRAFLHATSVGPEVTQVAAHVHGGAGVALESEVVHCLQRVRAWAVLLGDPRREIADIADRLLPTNQTGS